MFVEVLLHKIQRLFDARVHDLTQLGFGHLPIRQTNFTFEGDHFIGQRYVERTLLDFQRIRAIHGNFQARGNIIGEMIAPDGDHPTVLNGAVPVHNVVGRPAANVDDNRPQLLMFRSEHCQRRRQTADGDIGDVERDLFDATNRILQPRFHAVDHMDVGFQFRANHPHRGLDPVGPIDIEPLADGVQHHMVHRDIDSLGVQHDVPDFVIGNLAILVGDDHAAAVVKAAEMATGHTRIHVPNLDVGAFFRLN